MRLPSAVYKYRIENYRDLKELVDFAELINLPLSEAAAASIEEGSFRYVTVAELETYLYMCDYFLEAARPVVKQLESRYVVKKLLPVATVGVAARNKEKDRLRYLKKRQLANLAK